MDKCLLCLEIAKQFMEYIKVDSTQWQEENIKLLIEKHFWPLETIQPSSSMCTTCWQELNDFHKFYVRIEKAHVELHKTVLKTEDETAANNTCTQLPEQTHSFDSDDDCKSQDDCKDIFDKDGLTECPIEPEILMEQPLPKEFVMEEEPPLIKIEQDEDPCLDDDIPLKQLRKRGRPSKNIASDKKNKKGDPLKKTRKSKQTKNSTNKKTLELEEKTEQSIESGNKTQDSSIKLDLESALDNTNDDKNESFDTQHDENEDNGHTDADYLPKDKPAKTEQTIKRTRHRNPDEKTLQEYDKIIAENYKIFCSLCQTPIDNFIALRRHFKTEHKQRGYAHCCKRNFFTRGGLVDHIRFHLNPEHFKCKTCGKTFSDRSRLVCHMKLHDDENKLDKCEVCGKLFAEKGVLKKHLLTHSSDREMFPCTVCGKSFTNSSILNHHIESVHLNKFVQICDICGKSIRCRTAFDSHRKSHEPKTAEVSCDVCGLLLSSIEGMRRHRNSQHPEGGKKEHTCHICLKISPTLRALKSHIRNVHELGFNHKCNLCDKAFKRPAVLRDHMATHTGTALYNCPWCPKTFVSNGNMYNHRKKDHPREWEELQRTKYAGNIAS